MLTFLGLLLLMVSFGAARQQQHASESCGFAVQGEPAPGVLTSSSVAPGQTVEINSCNGGGHGSAKDNYVRLLVYVDKVDFEDCHYKPSLRIPRSLKVHTVW